MKGIWSFLKCWLHKKYHHVWGELLKLFRSHLIFQQLWTSIDGWTNCLITNKLFGYIWNVILLNIWCDRSRSKIGVVSETMWAARFLFELTPDIFGFSLHFIFLDLLPKKDQSESGKICALLIFENFNHLFVSKSFYDSVDFVQLDG